MTKSVEPSIRENAFTCPHCSAFTTQFWHDLYGEFLSNGNRLPFIGMGKNVEAIDTKKFSDAQKAKLRKLIPKFDTQLIFFDNEEYGKSLTLRVYNLHVSECYNCKKIAVWVHDRLVFPPTKHGVTPNQDMDAEVIKDFEEAREIVNQSPRGAAALLRLCVQKICIQLKEKGKSIDADIASLVAKGLNPIVQQALDAVRVIGNEAVHPGEMDLRDDRETALKLFDLVNAIADQMISHPKRVKELYDSLPPKKLQAIDKRDGTIKKTVNLDVDTE